MDSAAAATYFRNGIQLAPDSASLHHLGCGQPSLGDVEQQDRAERSLVASGKTDLVLHTRRYFQQTMRDDLSVDRAAYAAHCRRLLDEVGLNGLGFGGLGGLGGGLGGTGGGLGAFLGFFHREFRAHDFALGRRNMQRFLARRFSKPVNFAFALVRSTL